MSIQKVEELRSQSETSVDDLNDETLKKYKRMLKYFKGLNDEKWKEFSYKLGITMLTL